MKSYILKCQECGKKLKVPYRSNEKVWENVFIKKHRVLCYDCDNKLWWEKHPTGEGNLKELSDELKGKNRIVNFI